MSCWWRPTRSRRSCCSVRSARLAPAERIGVARDGEEALDYLLGRNAFRHRLGGGAPAAGPARAQAPAPRRHRGAADTARQPPHRVGADRHALLGYGVPRAGPVLPGRGQQLHREADRVSRARRDARELGRYRLRLTPAGAERGGAGSVSAGASIAPAPAASRRARETHRLHDAAVGPGLVALRQLAGFRSRGEHDDRVPTRCGGWRAVSAGPRCRRGAGAELEQDQRRERRPQAVPEGVPAEQVVERLLAVARHADPFRGVNLAERTEQQLRLERVGLHQQDIEVVRASGRRRPA